MAFAFHYLAKEKAFRKKMHAEVAPMYGKTRRGEFTNADLANVEYLDAFINETLRMFPPAATNGPRVTPPEGIELDGVFVPGGVTVYTIIYAYHRSKSKLNC
jgi:cytochrome P450